MKTTEATAQITRLESEKAELKAELYKAHNAYKSLTRQEQIDQIDLQNEIVSSLWSKICLCEYGIKHYEILIEENAESDAIEQEFAAQYEAPQYQVSDDPHVAKLMGELATYRREIAWLEFTFGSSVAIRHLMDSINRVNHAIQFRATGVL